MPDLQDGESVEIQGSGSRPYVLKNLGGVYSCSCPAWRNQWLPIERRTCKHLRNLRGDAAEEARLGKREQGDARGWSPWVGFRKETQRGEQVCLTCRGRTEAERDPVEQISG